MTIPDGIVLLIEGHIFFMIEMLRPAEDVPGDYINGKAWYWKVYAMDGHLISYGEVKHRESCRSGAKRAAKRWLLRHGGKRYIDKKTGLTKQQIQTVEAEVKMLLHAARDAMRNRGIDTTQTAFVANEGFYGEAFGIMRGLQAIGFGDLDGSINTPQKRENLRWWFADLESQVLEEEHFGGSGKCQYCFHRYGKDDASVGQRTEQCPICKGNCKVNIAGVTDICGHCHGTGKVSKETARRLKR